MSSKDFEFFKNLLGEENVFTDKAHLFAYSYDATRKQYLPECVLFPRDENDISNILKYANKHKIAITPRGAGSGFSGGSIPLNGGIVLSYEKHMNKILEINIKDMIAKVQPGVINKNLQNEVEKLGLFYPPDPASYNFSTIGGNVSENAGGMRAVKYGLTKDYVLSLRAVLANGDIIQAGKQSIKDVAGYNICGLLIASEGTLACLSEITLKLRFKPKIFQSSYAVFNNVQDAMNAVCESLSCGVTPVAMEFLDNLTINAVEQKFHKNLPIKAGAILICEVDGNLKQEINEQLCNLEKYFKKNGCIEFKIAYDNAQRNDLWFARKNASQSMSVYGNIKLNEDIAVPRSNLPTLLDRLNKISQKYDLVIACFGHAGDGNVHTNIMLKSSDELKKGHAAMKEVYQAAIDLNGTITGEHGVGISKADFMNLAFSDAELNLFKAIKKAFDPNNILNPHKMGLK